MVEEDVGFTLFDRVRGHLLVSQKGAAFRDLHDGVPRWLSGIGDITDILVEDLPPAHTSDMILVF